MRPSFLRVRSCVSSSERPIESTLSFTSPTLVRTNFLLAHAVDPPIANATTGTATNIFRNMTILLMRRVTLPRHIAASGPNNEILLLRTHDQRMPARRAARFERDQVLMPQLVDDLARRGASLGRGARHERVAAG